MELLTLMGVLAVALALTALARRYNLSAPLLIVVVALGVSFIPGVPRIELEPELILTLVLPPLLYSTALESSPREAVLACREAGELDDDVLRKVLRELDLEELALTNTLTTRVS